MDDPESICGVSVMCRPILGTGGGGVGLVVFQELLAGAKSSPGKRQKNGRPPEGHAGTGSAGSSESTGNGGAYL